MLPKIGFTKETIYLPIGGVLYHKLYLSILLIQPLCEKTNLYVYRCALSTCQCGKRQAGRKDSLIKKRRYVSKTMKKMQRESSIIILILQDSTSSRLTKIWVPPSTCLLGAIYEFQELFKIKGETLFSYSMFYIQAYYEYIT